jgi:cytochrome b pre-mRNA-processing protein 3
MALPGRLGRLLAGARGGVRAEAEALYHAAVARARDPAFYGPERVPDSLDGRYDMIVLHVALLLRGLKRSGAAGAPLARALSERMFDDFDRSLRELGVGDLGVARRIKAMARGFYGRLDAYDAALEAADDAALAAALRRNLLATAEGVGETFVRDIAAYVRAADSRLAAAPLSAYRTGWVPFPDALEAAP